MSASPAQIVAHRFEEALAGFSADKPALLLSHNDADGLAAAAILSRAFTIAGRPLRTRILGRGETPWSSAISTDIAREVPGGLIVADLGTRAGTIARGLPAVIIDHHKPTGVPENATLISGLDFEPSPTSSLLAYWAARALTDNASLLWLAAIGLIGDMAEKAGFAELDEARIRYGITALRDATALINAPRRTASGDPSAALALLMREEGPKPIVSGGSAEAVSLRAAKEEVKAALDAGKRIGPKVRNGVALIRFDTPCQIHPLLAQTWRGRLPREIVMAANASYRPGWVHFAVRSAQDLDLTAFLAARAPPGADENYGSGHRAATGGALRPADWNMFVEQLGFGPEAQVAT